jgi:hypothetical protein
MGKGKIKFKRHYAPVKFGERLVTPALKGHRLAIKRARQALDYDEQLPIAGYPQENRFVRWNVIED